MRRAPGLVELSRREFCAFACGAAATAALASCTATGPGAIETGGLTGDDDANNPADANNDDSGSSGSGSGSGINVAACPASGATDSGKLPSAITTPVYVSSGKFFILRDSNGLYAMTAVCTHEGATCDYESAQNDIYCPRHGATFSLTGAVTQGPATKALNHYAMCTMSNGNVGVIASQTVSSTQRYNF